MEMLGKSLSLAICEKIKYQGGLYEKKNRCLLGVILSVWMIGTTVFAAGSYSSTYDMKAGVFSRDITANKYIATTVNPTQGTSDCMMGVILATKHWYGWDGPEMYVLVGIRRNVK